MSGDNSSFSRRYLKAWVLPGIRNDSILSVTDSTLQPQHLSDGFQVLTGHEPRRLAALVYADVVGYCNLMGQDDTGTYARLTHLRQMLFEPALQQYGGTLVNAVGDSLLMEFPSVVSAMRFAVEAQTRVPEFDNDDPPNRVIRFRMGMNVGDAMSDGANIMYGDSINIAARLQVFSPPGGICASTMVRDQLPPCFGLRFQRLGVLNLKNIARPVEAFVLHLDDHARPRTLRLRRVRRAILPVCVGFLAIATVGMSVLPHYRSNPIVPHTPSILVLPFRNVSNDAEQQYLADAVTSDVTTDLSRMKDAVVISPATAFTYKGQVVDPRQIYQDIGVRYLLVGSIRHISQQVNTNIQLIDAASGVQLWGERFENDFVNLERLEDAVAGRIAASLDVQLAEAEGRRAEQAVTPSALDLRLRATSIFFQSVTPENTMAARNLLTQATRLDPGSAEAWARLAQLTASDYFNHWNGTGREQLGAAEEAVRKALLIDPNLPLAHFANGFIQRARGEHQLALEAFTRAIDLNPNFALAYAQIADELILTGRANEAQQYVEKAIKLSPRDPSLGIFYWLIGRADFCIEQYDRAIPWLRKSVEVRPNLWYNRLYLASAYALQRNKDEARKTLEDFNRRFPQPIYTLAIVTAHEGTNPDNDPTVVAARNKFHQGLLLAGMAEN